MLTPVMCMALAVYFEARSEPESGQYAVAEVILNRANSPKYPDDVCDVVKYDPGAGITDCHFSFWCDGKPENIDDVEAFERALLVAVYVLTERHDRMLPEDTMWYHADFVSPAWANNLTLVRQEGNHLFYRP